MKTGISKSRVRRVVELRRRIRANRGPRTGFRDGTALALLCIAATLALTLALSFSVPGSLGTLGAQISLPRAIFANFGVLFASAVCGRLLLGELAPEVLGRNSRILMLCLVAVFADALSVASVQCGVEWFQEFPVQLDASQPSPYSHLFGLLLPHLFAPTFATLLAGPGAGIALGCALALQSPLFVPPEAGLPAVLAGALAAIVAPLLVARVRRRVRLVRLLLLLGLVQTAAFLLSAVVEPDVLDILVRSFEHTEAASHGATALALLVGTILLPTPLAILLTLDPMEHIFATCSNVRLDLFADLSHPLLKRLALEAPGTYHHSLVVANLASAAADAIGANGLLALVGGYYHDIGKLAAPEKFTENLQIGQANPHDALAPQISALVLSAHVKDGIALAVNENLPIPVRNIIAEHHGTSVMAFFYDKAKKLAAAKAAEEGREPEPVDENLFRYGSASGGSRRPASAEAAIVSLADSVEAASRSLPSVTPAQLEKLVDSIVAAKVRDGQLDLSPLTYPDVVEIRRTFAETLATALHGRIAYPKSDDEGGKTSEKPAAATSAATSQA